MITAEMSTLSLLFNGFHGPDRCLFVVGLINTWQDSCESRVWMA